MSDPKSRLARAARQLIETDLLLGGEYMPAGRNPLPAPAPRGPVAETAGLAAPAADSAAPATLAGPIGASMTVEEKATALGALDAEHVRSCRLCALASGRRQTVFGEGSPDAELVFVGEGPGEEEDRTGRPFVGRAGELLTKMVSAMGLERSDVYIANIVKCRPPGNRTPLPDEAAACMPYLVRQLQVIAPKVIVTLGNPATQGLLNTKIGITRIRGQWQRLPAIGEGLEGIAVMPTFHPAYLLRNYSPDTRGKVWDDLKKVMDFLGLKRPGKK